MILLRLTTPETTREVRLDRAEGILGSAPTADVRVEHPGLPARALSLKQVALEVEARVLDGDRSVTLRVGDAIVVAGVEVALVGLLPLAAGDGAPPTPGPVFGGYEDDLVLAAPPTFELAPATPPPTILGAPAAPRAEAAGDATRLPRADGPAPGGPRRTPAASPERRPAAGKAPPMRATPTATARTAAAAHAASTPGTLKPKMFPDPDFGTELVAQLKRSPFFALSLAIHLLIFFVLTLVDSTVSQERVARGPGAVTASMSAEDEELGKDAPEIEDEGLPLPEAELPDLADLMPPLEETQPPRTPQPSPFEHELRDMEREPPPPLDIGFMPGMTAVSAKTRRRQPKMPPVDMNRTFTKGMAGSSNERSAQIVRAQLGRGLAGNGVSLEDLQREDVLVIDGSFDHIERVLDALQIEYVKRSPWSLTGPNAEDFTTRKIVFWNCGEALTRKRMTGLASQVKDFVRDGGYLFTTDWGVVNVLQYAFPGYIKTTGNRAHLPEMVLPIGPAPSAKDHPLLEGVFLPNVQGKWWLEQASFDLSVGRKDSVVVLIESPVLSDTFNRSPAVAATFHYGRGRVLHAMGHYYQEAGNLAGTVAAHRLALNFVLMRLAQDKPGRR